MKSSEKAPDLIVYESTEQNASFIEHKEDHDSIPDSFLD